MTTIDSSGKRVFKDDRDIKIYDPFKGMISEAKLDRIMEIFNCKGTTGMSKRSINEAGRDLENPPSVIMNWEEESEFYESLKKQERQKERQKVTGRNKVKGQNQSRRRQEQWREQRKVKSSLRSSQVVRKIRAKAMSRIGLPSMVDRLNELTRMREAVRERKANIQVSQKQAKEGRLYSFVFNS